MKDPWILDLKFDYYATSQYRALHLILKRSIYFKNGHDNPATLNTAHDIITEYQVNLSA